MWFPNRFDTNRAVLGKTNNVVSEQVRHKPRCTWENQQCGFRTGSTQTALYLGKPTMWFPNRFDTNRAVQSQKMPRGWKFWIQKVEELCYPCSENKGADQLRGYREADLRLCFRICTLLVFSRGGLFVMNLS